MNLWTSFWLELTGKLLMNSPRNLALERIWFYSLNVSIDIIECTRSLLMDSSAEWENVVASYGILRINLRALRMLKFGYKVVVLSFDFLSLDRKMCLVILIYQYGSQFKVSFATFLDKCCILLYDDYVQKITNAHYCTNQFLFLIWTNVGVCWNYFLIWTNVGVRWNLYFSKIF